MKKVSMRKLSLLGLILIGASAVTAAVLPKHETRQTGTGGDLVLSDDGVTLTCVQDNAPDNVCGYTATNGALSSTSSNGVGTSTITELDDAVTDTANNAATSVAS